MARTVRTAPATNVRVNALPRFRAAALASLLPLTVAACGHRDQPQTFAAAPPETAMGTTKIHEPAKLWSIETGRTDALGTPLRVACVTCHSLRTPNALPEKPEELKDFHRGLQFNHGNNKCSSCHVVGAQDALRLADGSTIPMRDALVLCGQCHGSQLRDYKAGAHGGMSGHWDLASGGRLRNHCVDCHDPHVPKFTPSTPVLPPRDRHLGPPVPHEGGPAIPRLSQAGSKGGHS